MQGGDVVWQQLQHAQQADSQDESESGDNDDVHANQLADKDSLFVDISGLKVHYKQAYPAKVPFCCCSFLSCALHSSHAWEPWNTATVYARSLHSAGSEPRFPTCKDCPAMLGELP